ncbi:hypothetical protein BGW42_005596 [Actinomortierella wolfii]|nr:hypothetical protein BGW42_005596 [Actinomortierella wolfii]
MLGSADRCLYIHLTWAFVGHRLDEVEELEIGVDDQERYLKNAAKMTRLRKIWIQVGKDYNYKEMYDFAVAMVKEIQLHHGPYQLRECHMIPNPLTRGTYPDIFNYDTEVDLSDAWRVLSLLPPPRHYLTLPRPDGSTVSLDQPFDPYMATIDMMWGIEYEERNFPWRAMKKLYPDHSQAHIMQRLRDTTNGNDEDLLAWAAYEAEHYDRQPGGIQLVPLKSWHVMYDRAEYSSTARTDASKGKILQDGLFGFSRTLDYLSVSYPQSNDGMVDHLLTFPRALPKLKSLNLDGLAVDRSVWELVPNLEELFIHFGIPPLRGEARAAPNESQEDQNTGSTSSSLIAADTTITTTTAAIKQQPQRQLIGDFHEFKFSFAILRSCPTLRLIVLDHDNDKHLFPLRAKGILDDSFDEDNSQMVPFTHSNLLRITFYRNFVIELGELACLLQALPGLRRIEMESVFFGKGFGDREMIETTKTHPALFYVSSNMVRTTDPPSALGLLDIIFETPPELDSVIRFIHSEEDDKAPEKRNAIIYRFDHDWYALRL